MCCDNNKIDIFIIVDCKDFFILEYIILELVGCLEGLIIKYKCEIGFVLEGILEMICKEDGMWFKLIFKC